MTLTEKRTRARNSMVLVDPNAPKHVTWNEETHIHFIKRISCWSRKSFWYTDKEVQRFREEYRSDMAVRNWIKQQNVRNHIEATWRTSPFTVVTKVTPIESGSTLRNKRSSHRLPRKHNARRSKSRYSDPSGTSFYDGRMDLEHLINPILTAGRQ
mmetsp:Transcript_21544/g.53421  ORF Transcript_21544/g.53421 Transcript_21544/m.53421 type:complete len:155 (+) Transcript_21544:129-593(+)